MIPTLLVLLAAQAVPTDAVALESDGVVLLEVESAPVAPDWKAETSLQGFTGASYYTWTGPDLFGGPGKGVLRYVFRVRQEGVWHLRIRNRHDFEDSTLQNDCFTRMDGGAWVKTFSSARGAWVWNTNHELPSGKPPASYVLSPGEHVLELCGRSKGFSIDRLALYRDGQEKAALDPSRPPTPSLHAAMTGPGPYAKLSSLVAKLRSGRGLGEARRAAAAKRSSPDPAEAAEAAALHDSLTRYGEGLLAAADGASPVAAIRVLEEAEALYAGDEIAAQSKERREALKKEPKVQEELKAWALWERIQEGVARLKPYAGSRDPRSEGFRRLNAAGIAGLDAQARALASKHPDTDGGRRAAAFGREYGGR
jgi:hypothetical protein